MPKDKDANKVGQEIKKSTHDVDLQICECVSTKNTKNIMKSINNKAIYESIMRKVSVEVKNALNESWKSITSLYADEVLDDLRGYMKSLEEKFPKELSIDETDHSDDRYPSHVLILRTDEDFVEVILEYQYDEDAEDDDEYCLPYFLRATVRMGKYSEWGYDFMDEFEDTDDIKAEILRFAEMHPKCNQIVADNLADFENACDDLHYGYGYKFWRKTCSMDNESDAKKLWDIAVEYMANQD